MTAVLAAAPLEREGLSNTNLEVQLEQDDDVQFPEGGWRAWSTVFGAALSQFASFGYTNAFGVYQGTIPITPIIISQTSNFAMYYSASDIGWIGGIQIFLVLSSGIVTGRAFDRGYFHHLMITGVILHSFSYFMLSLCQPNKYYQIFLSQGLGGGLAAGLIFIPSTAIVSHYFKRNRPLAMGLVGSGTALGAVLYPIILNRFLYGSLGFANGVRVVAGLNTGLLVIANLLMRTRLPPKKKGSVIPIAEFSRDPPYLLALFGGMLAIFGFSFPVFFLQLYSAVRVVNRNIALYCIPIMNAASIFGRIIPAIFAPKLGVFNLLIVLTVCESALLYSIVAVESGGAMIAFAIIYGFISGGGVTLTPATLASLAKDVDEIGARIGVAFALAGVCGLFAVPVAGALLTGHFYWRRPIIFAGTMVLGGATCYTIARLLLVRRRKTQVV